MVGLLTVLTVLVAAPADTTPPAGALPPPPPARIAVTPVPPVLAPDSADAAQRPRAVTYSDLYYTRLKIHQIASYATIPLFAGEYIVGTKLIQNGPTGDQSLRGLHQTLAAGVAGLFAVNTVTGLWNLWDGRHDPNGRTRRWIHGLAMLVADGGFVATGATAPGRRSYVSGRNDGTTHRAVAEASMGLALGSYLMMLLWKD